MKGEGKWKKTLRKLHSLLRKKSSTLRIGLRLTLLSLKELFGLAKEELAKETATVIVVSLIVGIIILLIDLGFEQAYSALVNLFA
mgnify:CR=1 FL=1